MARSNVLKIVAIIGIIMVMAFLFKIYNESDIRVLNAKEVTELFSDKTVEGYHVLRKYPFRSYYDANFHFRSYQNGAKKPKKGEWRADDNGDICITWSNLKSYCRKMIVDSKGNYQKVEIGFFGQRDIIVTFSRFTDGNIDDL